MLRAAVPENNEKDLTTSFEVDMGGKVYFGFMNEYHTFDKFGIFHLHQNQCSDVTGRGYQIHARDSGIRRVIGWRFSNDLESFSRKEMWRFSDDLESVPMWKDIEQRTPKEPGLGSSTSSQTMTQPHGIKVVVACPGPPFVGTSEYPAARCMFGSQPTTMPGSQSPGGSAPTGLLHGPSHLQVTDFSPRVMTGQWLTTTQQMKTNKGRRVRTWFRNALGKK
jgi:hypothetical protein